MPNDVSGIDLALIARRTHEGIPVVLVSGYYHEKASNSDALGEFVLLEKPFSCAKLVDTVASMLLATDAVSACDYAAPRDDTNRT